MSDKKQIILTAKEVISAIKKDDKRTALVNAKLLVVELSKNEIKD